MRRKGKGEGKFGKAGAALTSAVFVNKFFKKRRERKKGTLGRGNQGKGMDKEEEGGKSESFLTGSRVLGGGVWGGESPPHTPSLCSPSRAFFAC